MAKGINLVRSVVAGLLLVVLGACAATYVNHGYVPADSELSQIKLGETKADVQKVIGPPSAEGMQQGDAWYYVQSRWRHMGPFAPHEVQRQVVAISFTPQGKVANIERFGLEHGEIVTISRRVTTSSVKGLTLLQQLFNDLGRFDPTQFLKRSGS